jgi:CIC family chloride channel protein
MGVLFAAFLRAPMTSVFMVLEVSGSYSIILPVIVANTLAYVLSRTLQPTAIFDILTRQDGLDLPSMEEQREEHVLRVEDAMEPYAGPVLNSEMSIAEANKRITDVAGDVFLVQMRPSGWTSASRDLLRRLVSEGKSDLTLASALPSTRLPYMHPDFPLDSALRYVSETPIVPVVSRADFRTLEGVISSQAVLNRYRVVPREL